MHVVDLADTLVEPLTYIYPTRTEPMPSLTRLRELRLRAAMTQTELAQRAGITRGTIIRLEQGDPNVKPTTLRKLARALKVKPTDLWEE